MAENIIDTKMKQAIDSEANWREKNPILLNGMLGYVSDRYGSYKIGDGIRPWNSLPYALPDKTDLGIDRISNLADSQRHVGEADWATNSVISHSMATIETPNSGENFGGYFYNLATTKLETPDQESLIEFSITEINCDNNSVFKNTFSVFVKLDKSVPKIYSKRDIYGIEAHIITVGDSSPYTISIWAKIADKKSYHSVCIISKKGWNISSNFVLVKDLPVGKSELIKANDGYISKRSEIAEKDRLNQEICGTYIKKITYEKERGGLLCWNGYGAPSGNIIDISIKPIFVKLYKDAWQQGNNYPYGEYYQSVQDKEIKEDKTLICFKKLDQNRPIEEQKKYNKSFNSISNGHAIVSNGTCYFFTYKKPTIDIYFGIFIL